MDQGTEKALALMECVQFCIKSHLAQYSVQGLNI